MRDDGLSVSDIVTLAAATVLGFFAGTGVWLLAGEVLR